MPEMKEHHRGDTLSEARAEALQDIEAMEAHGWRFSRLKIGRDESGHFVDVTYTKGADK